MNRIIHHRYLSHFPLRNHHHRSNHNNQFKPWNILFFGSDTFSCRIVNALIDAPKDLVENIHIVVPPSKRTGRGLKQIHVPELKILATKAGLSCDDWGIDWKIPPRFQNPPTNSINSNNILLTASFGHLLPTSLISHFPPLQSLNIHPSLIPRHRGAAPIHWTILKGDRVTGVTVLQISRGGFDKGGVVMRGEVMPISPTTTFSTLFNRLANESASLTIKTLQKLSSSSSFQSSSSSSSSTSSTSLTTSKEFELNSQPQLHQLQLHQPHQPQPHQPLLSPPLQLEPQDPTQITKAPKITPSSDSVILWELWDAETVVRVWRAFDEKTLKTMFISPKTGKSIIFRLSSISLVPLKDHPPPPPYIVFDDINDDGKTLKTSSSTSTSTSSPPSPGRPTTAAATAAAAGPTTTTTTTTKPPTDAKPHPTHPHPHPPPGSIWYKNNNNGSTTTTNPTLLVACKKGFVRIDQIGMIHSKKLTNVHEWFNGYGWQGGEGAGAGGDEGFRYCGSFYGYPKDLGLSGSGLISL